MKDGELAIALPADATSNEPADSGAIASDVATSRSQDADHRWARIGELMDVHGDAVIGFCMRSLRIRALADDVFQQVFLEAYRDLDRCTGQSERGWLFGIARHRCVDAVRSQRRWKRIAGNKQVMLELEEPAAGPLEHLDGLRRSALLAQCLQRLSPEVRATVLLRFETDATYEQLAARLSSTAETLQIRVSRALPILRRCLEKKGWADACGGRSVRR